MRQRSFPSGEAAWVEMEGGVGLLGWWGGKGLGWWGVGGRWVGDWGGAAAVGGVGGYVRRGGCEVGGGREMVDGVGEKA